jgi:putative DNA primase/helicase
MTDAKQQVLDAFAEVGVAEQRFINVNDGEKGTYDHDTRYDDPHDVPGTNYGIYSDADDLVVLDVDVHKEGAEEIADEPVGRLNHLGMTFTIQSPHTGADSPGGHRFFRLEGDETAAELFKRVFGKKNPVPSWGEVISENKYVVGAGSQLDGCDKDWCDECATADGGSYVVKHDTPIRSVKPDTLVDVLAADPDLDRRDTDSDVTNYSNSGGKNKSTKDLVESEGDASDLTEAEVKELLGAIPGDQHFDDWIRTGYAVYGCLGEDGKEVFEDWSEGNKKWEKGESQRQIDYIWKNAKPNDDGEIYAGSGTLIHEARDHGYDGEIGATPQQSKPEAPDEPDNPNELTWSDVRARYEFVQKEDNFTKGYARQAAADVLENQTSWMFVRESERLWVYDAQTGQYDKYGASKARSVLEEKLGEHYAASEKREIIDRIEARNQVYRKVLNAREHDDPLVCVGNCVVNLRTGESTDHSPEYRFVRGLDVEWHPAEADPEKIVNFLDEVTQRPADRDTLLDHLAHGLMPGHPYRAFVVCYGPGGNGKTQVSEVFRGFVGSDNAAAVEIDELADGDFATGDLPGTFINWGDDMAGDGGGQLSDLSLLKKATGGSEIRANEKYEKTFNFKNEAAMFFSANEPPRIGEQKASIQDRIYPIEMPYRFTSEPDPDDPMEKEKTPNISKDLLEDDAAMRGLLLLAVQHAQKLIESRGEYSQPESPAERLEKYNRSADPIVKFGSRALEAASGEYMIRKDDAYRVFRDMAESWEERSASEDGFKRQLPGAINFDVEGARSRALASADDGQDRVRCWKRVKWTPFAREFMPDWLLSRYADHFEDSDEDAADAAADADDEPTPVPQRDAGYETFTATVTAVIDPKPWLEGEGTLVDETGAVIDYIVRDGSGTAPTIEEGDEYHFRRARLTADEAGAPVVEIRPGATEVKQASRPSGLAEHEQGDEDADTAASTDSAEVSATDGGEPDEDADSDDERVMNQDIRDRIVQETTKRIGGNGASRADLLNAVSSALGVSEDRVDREIDEVSRNGRIHEPMEDRFKPV